MNRNSYQERMLKVLRYVSDHLDEPISLEDLAAQVHFSPYHFHRIFTGMMGESVMSYVRRLRLERAAFRLGYGRRSILDIALEAGFESNESFTRAFKAQFTVPPSIYRKRTRPESLPGKNGFRNVPLLPQLQGGMEMNVTIQTLDAVRVAYVRHVGPYDECGKAWGRICSWAGPRGLLTPETRFMGVCHDDPGITEKDRIRYDACITLGRDVSPEGEIGVMDIPAGDYGVAIHEGPFENLHKSYEYLCGVWGPSSRREIAHAPSIEVYLTDPETTPPQDLRTEIRIPLEPA